MDDSVRAEMPDGYSEEEFERSFGIAKQALQLVGKLRTPPTPEIYEFWYRHVEGVNKAFSERVNFMVEDLGEATRELIEALRGEYLLSGEDGDRSELVESLMGTFGGVQSIVQQQASATSDYGDSIGEVSAELSKKDVTSEDLGRCVGAVLARNKKMQSDLAAAKTRLQKAEKRIGELRIHLNESQRSMMIDPSTGVGNRRYFDWTLKTALEHPDRGIKTFFLLLVDLDSFKRINDSFGHDCGDSVLRFMAAEIQRLARGAAVARYGGDEFAIFLRVDDYEEGKSLAEAIRVSMEQANLKVSQTGEPIGRISVSIGVSILRPDDDAETWFLRADQLLYSGKQGSKNMVSVERNLR